MRGMSSVEVTEPEPARFQVETSLRTGRAPRWTLGQEVLEPGPVVRLDREGTVHSLCFTSTDSSMSGPVVFTTGKSRYTGQLTVKGELPLSEVTLLLYVHLRFNLPLTKGNIIILVLRGAYSATYAVFAPSTRTVVLILYLLSFAQ